MRHVEPTAAAVDQLVRCDTCGRTELCTPEILLGFTLSHWPTCCGAVMTYYKARPFPVADPSSDTNSEMRSLTEETPVAVT